MEDFPKFLKGIALSALASVVFSGSALAVPTPIYPRFDPGSVASATSAPQAPTTPTLGARILFRSNDRSLTRADFRAGGASIPPDAGTVRTHSRSKARYIMSGLLLAAMTPLALHHSGDNTMAVQTQTDPAGSPVASLGGGDHPGDDGGDDPGDVSGGGDPGSSGTGDDPGDCDTGGGGDHGGGDTSLPEPGTVPLVGAGLMMALAFRSRRER